MVNEMCNSKFFFMIEFTSSEEKKIRRKIDHMTAVPVYNNERREYALLRV